VGTVTAAVDLPTATVDTAALRARGRVVEVAANLLASLDYTGAGGGLPVAVRMHVDRLRHAVKLAILTTTAPALPALAPSPTGAAALGRWAAAQPWAQPNSGPVGWVYLLCFRDPTTGEHRPLKGNGTGGQVAGHYWGWTSDLVRRIEREHRNPYWSGPGRLVKVALGAGLTFELAYVEYPAGRGRERRLKNQGSAYRRCPLCRGTGNPLDPAAAAATLLQVAGAQ